jgi:methenyltetrahydromethanopterin cyclohydrolase
MFSINQQAVKIVKEQILPFAEELNCKVHYLKNGATVVDMGVEARGGWQAGKLFVEATVGGMGIISFGQFHLGELTFPSIDVYFDRPVEATLSSQFSGWKMPGKDIPGYINPIGSGPARAIARNDIFSQSWHYQDTHHATVFAAQTQEIPDESIAQMVADECKLPVENVYILATKTANLTGAIQVCSRTVEASVWRLFRKGFDIGKIMSGMGSCPIAPPIKDELKGMDRVNTALLYGVTVRYLVDSTDEEIEAVINTAPFSASKRYGERFIDIFEEGKRDFYIVDKDIHTVARYEITNYATGKTFVGGVLREDMLKDSFYRE